MAILNTQVAAAVTTNIFTASTGTDYAITTMILCNTSDTYDAFLDLWAVPYGQSAGGIQHQILKSVKIPTTETFVMDSEKFILSDGDALWARCSPLNANLLVNACVSSVTIS